MTEQADPVSPAQALDLVARLEERASFEFPEDVESDDPPEITWGELREIALLLREAATEIERLVSPSSVTPEQELPTLLQVWWAWCNAHPHALDTVAKRPAAVIEFLWAEVQRLRVTPTQETQGIPREGFKEAIDTVTHLARSEMRRFHGADSGRGSFEDCRSPSCVAIKLLDIWLADEAASRVTPTPEGEQP